MIIRLFILMGFFPIISCSSVRKTSVIDIPYVTERYLIITADDFGASKNINEGIEIAVDQKVITTISVLSNFSEYLPELKQLSEDHPDIGIGVHLNIITGKPLLGAEQVPTLVSSIGSFYTIDELLPVIKKISPDDLTKELRAQILALINDNITLDHLSDQYGILSLYRPFFDVMVKLAKEFNVPVRTPIVSSVKYPDLFPNSNLNRHGRQIALKFAFNNPLKAIRLFKYSKALEMERKVQKMDELGILHPDLLIDYFWGDPSPANYLYIIEHLPDGISELILHVGTSTRQENYPGGLDLDYFKNREKELNTITDDQLKKYINYLNIKTIGYSDILNYRIK
jgi:predicted glycoside hydrolase/deacetylase ChbG (UPF0249 family)